MFENTAGTVKVYMVLGDNGLGNSGNAVFGLYPTLTLAEDRIRRLEEEEEAAQYMYIKTVDYGPNGGDCFAWVCG
jgi:hypothetical protein